MKNWLPTLLILGPGIFLAACEQTPDSSNETSEPAGGSVEVATGESEYREIEWTDLIPEDDLEALMNPPGYISEIEDGTEDDVISSELKSDFGGTSNDRYQQALTSTRIIESMNDQAIKLPGFIVPLEFDEEQVTTKFFMVPFFGACLHLPPPPPNQIVYVEYPQGLRLESLTDTFWIEGVISSSTTENDVAKSAYSMIAKRVTKY